MDLHFEQKAPPSQAEIQHAVNSLKEKMPTNWEEQVEREKIEFFKGGIKDLPLPKLLNDVSKEATFDDVNYAVALQEIIETRIKH